MNRNISISKSADRFLSRVPRKHAAQIAKKIVALLEDPRPEDSISMKGSVFFRVDSGEYRIVYRFDNSTVFVSVIGKRNDGDVYRKAKRVE
ncbi:MAG TPA: addiction module toxin RelE [Synergistaceae bacterium]|jgi:mRNA interferase RelE/StbE|nr:addiction module toxin RelE [Synergistaceae bacterium]HCP07596.1 addiction module toxin RelE [Synergistaceae bacterium]